MTIDVAPPTFRFNAISQDRLDQFPQKFGAELYPDIIYHLSLYCYIILQCAKERNRSITTVISHITQF